MRKTILAAACLLVAGSASAFSIDTHDTGLGVCGLRTAYSLRIDDSAIAFTRASGSPQRVEMRHGTLLVDGKAIALSRADADRIAEYEATIRELVPEVKAIATEAIEIAFTAVNEVARTFATDADLARVTAKLEQARAKVSSHVDASFDHEPWDDAQFEKMIETTVTDLVPEIAATAASSAVYAALSGDESKVREIEAKAERLERTIEEQVERRADALEKRAESLCPIVEGLDEIETQLALRIDDQPLDIVRKR
ncbi:MAG TPA: DUF2884 family protein [Xanthomonadales bacterium]|nr:DUF2884 family protein [Xanthomonadales bacterium]